MTIEKDLFLRSDSKCELCRTDKDLIAYFVEPTRFDGADNNILICQTCQEQIKELEKININHWRCLNDSMWSTVPAVQVMVWRILTRIRLEGWPQDLLDMLYLDEETLAWAQEGAEEGDPEDKMKHLDSNGAVLSSGDSVVLIKDLNVKGGGFTAKRGTVVRGISLVEDNEEQIEGKVSGQQIVIITKFVKKSN